MEERLFSNELYLMNLIRHAKSPKDIMAICNLNSTTLRLTGQDADIWKVLLSEDYGWDSNMYDAFRDTYIRYRFDPRSKMIEAYRDYFSFDRYYINPYSFIITFYNCKLKVPLGSKNIGDVIPMIDAIINLSLFTYKMNDPDYDDSEEKIRDDDKGLLRQMNYKKW